MQKTQRLISLDVFRGLTIAAMILVNNPGSWSYVYPPLEHADWFGLTPTDLIFPFFLFIVGVAVKLSMDKRLLSGASRKPMAARIVRRTLILFALGLVLNAFPNFDLATWRIPGVLQRIAVCYFFAAFLYIGLARRVDGDIQLSWKPIAILTAALLIVYYALMRFVPVPGYGPGQMSSPEGNLAGYIDHLVFGAHVWFQTKTWDPEGILSTLPALATTLTGVLAGWWLKSGRDKIAVFNGLILAGVLGVVGGWLFSFFMPIGKNIWTSSYVLVSSGLALILLALIYLYTDIQGKKWGTKPFIVFGANAITVYFLSSIGAALMWSIHFSFRGETVDVKAFIYNSLLQPVFGDYFGSVVFALLYVVLWWAVMSVFYKKKIFIKV